MNFFDYQRCSQSLQFYDLSLTEEEKSFIDSYEATIFRGQNTGVLADHFWQLVLIPYGGKCGEIVFYDEKGNPNRDIFDKILESLKLNVKEG